MWPVSNSHSEGFVLPYVLVVIAILAVASTIAAERLQRSTTVLSRVQDQTQAEAMLMTAESEAIYSVLTGLSVDNGIDLNPNTPIQTQFGTFSADLSRVLSPDERNLEEPDIWRIDGGKRATVLSNGHVLIEIQDVAGLLSLISTEEESLEKLLAAAGAGRDEARSLTARLKDYTDFDGNRRFKGAEGADYRFRNKEAPTNSPLRSYEEMAQILGWAEAIPNLDFNLIRNNTTLKPLTSLKRQFARQELLDILKLEEVNVREDLTVDGISALSALTFQPSDNIRLTFWVQSSSGTYEKRVIEISRTVNNMEKPFRRFWVYETTVLENDLNLGTTPVNEQKNVLHTAPVRP